MPRNIEIKAAVRDFAPLVEALKRISLASPGHLWQEDTFFSCPSGRLKLRKFSQTSGELIYYTRASDPGPKESNYIRVPTSEPDLLRHLLASAHGIIGIVHKHRTVYMVGRTRVHLDDVEGLGKFAELEVVLADSESADIGMREARRLMEALGIRAEELVSDAYIDLLRAKHRRSDA
jgi:predicted adenylyl cyclase CyaB